MVDMRTDTPIHGRRRFLIGAAGVAAAPLVVGLAGCGTDRQPSQPSATEKDNAEPNSVAAATTVTSRRRLGFLEVCIGLGCQTMPGKLYGPVSSRGDMIALTRTAVDQGVTFFDTAEAYGPLESERIIGEALEPVRDQVVIASKFGFDIDPQTGLEAWRSQQPPRSHPPGGRRDVAAPADRPRRPALPASIDPTVPIEDVAGTVKDLISQGKVLHFGLSEPGLETVGRAHAVQPLAAIQNEYSMLWRGPEQQILPLCEELGIGFVPWAPVGVGFPTGTINPFTRFAEGDFRAAVPRNSPENLAANMPLVQLIRSGRCARALRRPRFLWPG